MMDPIRPEEFDRLGALALSDFDARIGESFSVDGDADPPLVLELVEATDLGRDTDPEGERRPFSLVLEGPAQPALPQSIYPLLHADLGRLPLFIVPIGAGSGTIRYEAVFR
jgi:hypothetical protein